MATAMLDRPASGGNAVPARIAFQARPLGRWAYMRALMRDPMSAYDERVVTERIYRNGGGPFSWTLLDPDAIGRVFAKDAANYWRPQFTLDLLWPLRNGLLTAPRPLWRTQRRAMAPMFAPRHVRGFAPAMDRAARDWADRLAQQDGEVVDVSDAMTALAYDVLADALFSGEVAGDPAELMRAIDDMLLLLGKPDPVNLLGLPRFVPRPTELRARPIVKLFRRLTDETVAMREARIARGDDVPDDFLTLLLRASDPETGVGLSRDVVIDNVLTFVAAGHETTARALTWALYLLAHHPGERERLEAEIAAAGLSGDPADWWQTLPFARAVIDETLRLYPSAPQLARMALEPTELCGEPIAAGDVVVIPPYAVHRHRDLWGEPDLFRPDRFMGDARKAMHRYQYLPFGAGERVCIGASFALQEAVILLVRLVERARFEDAGERPHPRMAITLRPEPTMRLRVRAR